MTHYQVVYINQLFIRYVQLTWHYENKIFSGKFGICWVIKGQISSVIKAPVVKDLNFRVRLLGIKANFNQLALFYFGELLKLSTPQFPPV